MVTELKTVIKTHIDNNGSLIVPFSAPSHRVTVTHCDTSQQGQWIEDAKELLYKLQEAVVRRTVIAPTPHHITTTLASSTKMINGVAKIGILYSGGLDSVILAALLDR